LAQVKTLMGATAYDKALASYVRNLGGDTTLTDAQALAAFAKLTPARQAAAPGQLLVGLLPQVDTARRQSFVAQVAGADTPRYADGLRQWLTLRTGQTYTLDQALAAFEALPVAVC
jgi:hypothetical protein